MLVDSERESRYRDATLVPFMTHPQGTGVWFQPVAVRDSSSEPYLRPGGTGDSVVRIRSSGKAFPMLQKSTLLVLAILLQGVSCPSASAAEREDVRKVVNLVTSVKMPYPEGLTRSRARTERVWVERGGTTTGCIGLEQRRWCYEYIAPEGNRLEMLRIRNEPLRGVYIGASYYYVVDFDLDGLVDVGSTTEIDAFDRQRRVPIANVTQFFHRSTKRGEQSQPEYQKMYDDGIQIALKYFGE
jgi:hypothetical protein